MSNTVHDNLRRIESEIAKGARTQPAERLKKLIEQIGPTELDAWKGDFESVIRSFEPPRQGGKAARRHRELVQSFEAAMVGGAERPGPSVQDAREGYAISGRANDLDDLRRDLKDLAAHHLFQWQSHYRPCLEHHLARVIHQAQVEFPHGFAREAFIEMLGEHVQTTFGSGYDHARARRDGGKIDHDAAVRKSLGGLSSLLRIPLDFYALRESNTVTHRHSSCLRSVMSAAVVAVLTGFANAEFGEVTGAHVLDESKGRWATYLAFLTPVDARHLCRKLANAEIAETIRVALLPLLEGIELFYGTNQRSFFPLPTEGAYRTAPARLDVFVRTPPDTPTRRCMATAYFEYPSLQDLEASHRLGVALIVSALRPDVHRAAQRRDYLDKILVPVTADTDNHGLAASRRSDASGQDAFRIWDDALSALQSRWRGASPITYNFARDFPLRKPSEARHFHVERTSVRDLLRASARDRQGILLWCSVRRSGKTTACRDLTVGTDDASVILQTCGAATDIAGSTFYRDFRGALGAAKSGEVIADDFVVASIGRCPSGGVADAARQVLILDEYEKLFRHFTVYEDDQRTRMLVLEPFLDQLVEFAAENLLVLLGQQPDAHFVLMDQNQLAPYVRQEAFPLFEHRQGTTSGEFADLIGKVFGGRIDFAADFADALYGEVAGHPWLTVNALVEFVEWLIAKERNLRERVSGTDFGKFVDERIAGAEISLREEFAFFRDYASRNMSATGYRSNPWIYTVYCILHGIGTSSVTVDEFKRLVDRVPRPRGQRLPAWDAVLQQATLANFLFHDGENVAARIPLLGRIAALARPSIA
ncbi:MAG: hypothetical protein F4Y26_02945 [Gammaproteobacteria bacterium]|nr:hypothetical protein [Gammaproteobacteria bacterium]